MATQYEKREIGRIMSGGETSGANAKNTILKALGFESDKDKDERARQKRIENLRAKQITRADFELPTQRQ
nr:hypothetical protein [uncultured Helicobacter sp.]